MSLLTAIVSEEMILLISFLQKKKVQTCWSSMNKVQHCFWNAGTHMTDGTNLYSCCAKSLTLPIQTTGTTATNCISFMKAAKKMHRCEMISVKGVL